MAEMNRPQQGAGQLTLEQNFGLQAFKQEAEKLTRDQAIDHMVKLYTQMIVKENTYKQVLKEKWGIGNSWGRNKEEQK